MRFWIPTGVVLAGSMFGGGVAATLTTYSNPTDGGRFRVNFDGRIAWEVIGDFTIGVNIIERYDSRPPAAGAAKRETSGTSKADVIGGRPTIHCRSIDV